MADTPPPAPGSGEYARRLTTVQAAMAAQTLTARIVADLATLYYLTGYNTWSFYTPQCLIIPAAGDPHLFTRAMDADRAQHTCPLPSERIHGYPEELVHSPDTHPHAWIMKRARELDLLLDDPACRIGIEGDSAFFTARGYLALAASIPRAAILDSKELINWARVVKSPIEQDPPRIAGTIATSSMAVAIETIREGRRQCDPVAEIMAAQAHGTHEHGGDYPAIVPMLPTGEVAGTPHLTRSEQPFRPGEPTTIELAGVYRRDHVPIARTVMLGDPTQRLADMVDTAEIACEGMDATRPTIRAGVTGNAVHTAFNDVISGHDLHKDSRIGYTIGIGYPPDWGERTISLRPHEEHQLKAGMALHVILGMWMDGWGYELSEPVLVAETGAERLTNLPQTPTIRK